LSCSVSSTLMTALSSLFFFTFSLYFVTKEGGEDFPIHLARHHGP
jgi:hypothetical protein